LKLVKARLVDHVEQHRAEISMQLPEPLGVGVFPHAG
jgi:hypothetical protein